MRIHMCTCTIHTHRRNAFRIIAQGQNTQAIGMHDRYTADRYTWGKVYVILTRSHKY